MYIENVTPNVIAQIVNSPSGLSHRLVLQPASRSEIGGKDGVPVWAVDAFKATVIGQRALADKQVVISETKKAPKKTSKPKTETTPEAEA